MTYRRICSRCKIVFHHSELDFLGFCIYCKKVVKKLEKYRLKKQKICCKIHKLKDKIKKQREKIQVIKKYEKEFKEEEKQRKKELLQISNY